MKITACIYIANKEKEMLYCNHGLGGGVEEGVGLFIYMEEDVGGRGRLAANICRERFISVYWHRRRLDRGDMKRNGNRTSNLVRFWRSRELCRSTVLHRERERRRRKPRTYIYNCIIVYISA